MPSDGDLNGAGIGPSTNGHAGNEVQEHRDSFFTRAIHVGSAPDPVTGAIIPGLHTATTYKQSGVGKPIVSSSLIAGPTLRLLIN